MVVVVGNPLAYQLLELAGLILLLYHNPETVVGQPCVDGVLEEPYHLVGIGVERSVPLDKNLAYVLAVVYYDVASRMRLDDVLVVPLVLGYLLGVAERQAVLPHAARLTVGAEPPAEHDEFPGEEEEHGADCDASGCGGLDPDGLAFFGGEADVIILRGFFRKVE